MLDNRLVAAVAIVGTLLSASCTAPYREPNLEARPPGHTQFPGIAQLVAQTQGKAMDVVMVHGMCSHGQSWANTTIRRLSELLHGPEEPRIEAEAVPDTNAMLYRAELATSYGTVHASAVVWSPIVAELKSQLCYDQTNKSESCKALAPDTAEYPYQRAALNRALKDGLLNDCLADAIIYQGKSRDAISSQVQHAILAAAAREDVKLARRDLVRAAARESTPIVFISESLGSKIAFDAIYRLQTSSQRDERAAGERIFDRFAQVFMMANQMPILALADQNLEGAVALKEDRGYPRDPLRALLEMRNARSRGLAMQSPLRVVSFTDPNDILSYVLVPSQPVAPFDVVDVVVSNATTYFGFLERPDMAHSGYTDNEAVMHLIVCGTRGCT